MLGLIKCANLFVFRRNSCNSFLITLIVKQIKVSNVAEKNVIISNNITHALNVITSTFLIDNMTSSLLLVHCSPDWVSFLDVEKLADGLGLGDVVELSVVICRSSDCPRGVWNWLHKYIFLNLKNPSRERLKWGAIQTHFY